ncbi:MAG: alpha/beta hydrolase [Deltaproteobacteria bacterium]|nr:alpha/beta hydrolase [Deltaproteobacteria bacterium]
MPSKYALAPEFAEQKGFTLPANRFVLRLIDAGLRWQRRGFPFGDAVAVRKHRMPIAGGRPIEVLEVSPKDATGATPTLVDYHGGAFFLSAMRGHLDYAERYAVGARCRVFVPEYRLSLDHPFPAAFDDAYATLEWVHANAGALGVDRERVVLIGDSAGGALAAGVAQRVLDQRGPAIRAQILVYPVTDHASKTESVRSFVDTPGWTGGSNVNMWKLYLRDTEYARSGGAAAPPPYAAPLHRKDFAGLPPAFVEVAEFDPLRDEGIAYARALEQAGVPVELHVVEGGIHGYDLVPESPLAARVLERRLEAIRRFFA